MRIFVLIFLSIVIVGCATSTVVVDMPHLEESSLVTVEDLRPSTEKENEIFSLLITSEAYGTYRRGDKLVNPNPLRIFQHRIYEKYANKGVVPDVKVYHLVVYMNLKSELRRGAFFGVLGGVIGSAVASGTMKYGVNGLATLTSEEEFNAFKQEYTRALYTEKENPGKVSVFKVYLEAEIDGKRVFVSTMTPTRLPKGVEKNSHVVAIETAMAYFLEQY